MTTNTYTCYIAACYGNSIMGSGAAGINASDACPTVAAAVKQVAAEIKSNQPYILKNLPVTVTTIQTTVTDGIPTISAFTTSYTGNDIAWLTIEATPLISDVVPANTAVAEPPETTTVDRYIVVCAADTTLQEGPDENYRKLLNNIVNSPDYQGYTDQAIVIHFEGTAEQIAVLDNLRIDSWSDDPDNYDEDDDDDDEGDDDEGDENDDDDDDEPSFTELTE